MNREGQRSNQELVLCEAEDVTGEFFWFIPKRVFNVGIDRYNLLIFNFKI